MVLNRFVWYVVTLVFYLQECLGRVEQAWGLALLFLWKQLCCINTLD